MADASMDARDGEGTASPMSGTESSRLQALIAYLTPERQTEARSKFARSDGAARELFLSRLELVVGPHQNPISDAFITGSVDTIMDGLPGPLKEVMDVVIARHVQLGPDESPSFFSVLLFALGKRDRPLP